MTISNEKIEELRLLLETKLGRPVSADEAREEARCFLTLLLMISEVTPTEIGTWGLQGGSGGH